MTKSIALTALTICLVGALSTACKKKDDANAGGDAAAATDPAAAAGDSLLGGFEGALTMHLTSPHRATADDITFLAKGDKLRFDAPASHHGEQTHVIFETTTKQMMVILDAQKTYMVMDLPKAIAAVPQGPGHVPTPTTPPTVTKTGKHEKIAGYDCEDWDIKDASGKKAQACIADGVPFIDFASIGPAGAAAGTPSAWMDELHGKKLFPLRAIDFDAAGKESSRMEVTKIEKKALDDSLFAIPAGYKKIEIPHFPGGMPGFPGGGAGGLPAGFPGAIPQPAHK